MQQLRRLSCSTLIVFPLLLALLAPVPQARATEAATAAAKIKTIANTSWAGYGIEGLEKFNAGHASVGGRWRVPTVARCGLATRNQSALWIGLGGGVGSGGLIAQVATTQNCVAAVRTYKAQYQMFGYPSWGPAKTIPKTVVPGDVMAAGVGYVETIHNGKRRGKYDLILQNVTRNWHFHKKEIGSVAPKAWRTANWIVEAPTVEATNAIPPLANFGTASFSSLSADGRPVTYWPKVYKYELTEPAKKVTGVITNTHKALPSTLNSTATGFLVSWKK
jgi:hypothetical protein